MSHLRRTTLTTAADDVPRLDHSAMPGVSMAGVLVLSAQETATEVGVVAGCWGGS